jgi:hypothetical protein
MIELSRRELQRVKVIENAVAGHITVTEAARPLSLSTRVEDPANPNGNDLSKELSDDLKAQLAAAAKRTLEQIESSGWEAVYGKTEKADKAARVEILRRAAAVATPSRPWLPKA